MNSITSVLDKVFLFIWGFTSIDLIFFLNGVLLSSIDNAIKTLMAVAGLIYFSFTISHKIKMYKLDRELKKEAIKKAKKENQKKE